MNIITTRFFQKNSRHFISVCLIIIFASCSDQEPAGSPDAQATTEQTIYEWKMITSWPKNLPALGTSPEYFADIVETMSNGRMKIRVYGANELVGGLEVFDAVSQGVAEIGHSGAYYWQGSGWDLEFIEKAGFSPVRMDHMLKLSSLESLSDPQMVNELKT